MGNARSSSIIFPADCLLVRASIPNRDDKLKYWLMISNVNLDDKLKHKISANRDWSLRLLETRWRRCTDTWQGEMKYMTCQPIRGSGWPEWPMGGQDRGQCLDYECRMKEGRSADKACAVFMVWWKKTGVWWIPDGMELLFHCLTYECTTWLIDVRGFRSQTLVRHYRDYTLCQVRSGHAQHWHISSVCCWHSCCEHLLLARFMKGYWIIDPPWKCSNIHLETPHNFFLPNFLCLVASASLSLNSSFCLVKIPHNQASKFEDFLYSSNDKTNTSDGFLVDFWPI